MKKKIPYFIALALVVSSCFFSETKVLANDTVSEAYAEITPYGAYLQAGRSTINKLGTGKIYASGTTFARTTVDKISVGVRVEKLVGNAWLQCDYFSASAKNTYTVDATKTLIVPIGYFYRVKSFHTAHTDSSSSVTEGLYI